jgi:hypothetical protein
VQRGALVVVDHTGGDGGRELRLGDRPRQLSETGHGNAAVGGDLRE